MNLCRFWRTTADREQYQPGDVCLLISLLVACRKFSQNKIDDSWDRYDTIVLKIFCVYVCVCVHVCVGVLNEFN